MIKCTDFIKCFGFILAVAQSNAQTNTIDKEKFHWGTLTQDTSYGYAAVVKSGHILYLSGVTSPGDFPTQVKNVYTTLENNLKRFGATFQHVVKENVFTTSIDSMKKYSEIRKPFYKNDYPAASWIGIKELFVPDRMLEVELVAHLPAINPKSSLPQNTWPAQVLTGTWIMNTSKGQIMEQWASGGKIILNGNSYRIKDKDTTLIESIRLVKENNEINFISSVAGQNNGQAVKFRMTSSADNIYVFENPTHDFPKRIVYDVKSKDILHAWIDGGESQTNKRSDFYYHRIR